MLTLHFNVLNVFFAFQIILSHYSFNSLCIAACLSTFLSENHAFTNSLRRKDISSTIFKCCSIILHLKISLSIIILKKYDEWFVLRNLYFVNILNLWKHQAIWKVNHYIRFHFVILRLEINWFDIPLWR